jgi:hypothetical protein
MNQIKNELALPPAVFTDKNAQELVRIWAAHGQQHVTLLSKLWDDEAEWDHPTDKAKGSIIQKH